MYFYPCIRIEDNDEADKVLHNMRVFGIGADVKLLMIFKNITIYCVLLTALPPASCA